MILFGKYLLKRGVLTPPQLAEATQSQVVFGGRLGTNLVELGYLQVDDLERYLSDLLGVPVAPREWLEHPDPEALEKVSADLVKRHGIFPLALEKQTLHLALSDPRNPDRIDDSAFATGFRIQPYVVSELRLTELLERHYGIPRETRYIEVGLELQSGWYAKSGSDEAPKPKRVGLAPEAREDIGDPLGADQELVDEAAFSALQGKLHSTQIGATEKGAPSPLPDAAPGSSDAAPESTAEPIELVVTEDVWNRLQADPDPRGAALAAVVLESSLASADNRDNIGRLALRLARLHTRAAALFVVRNGMISGFRGDGDAITTNIDGVLIPVEAETILAAAVTAGRPWRGEPPRGGVNGRLLSALRRDDVREALVLPIVMRGRVINLLYVDNGREPLAETAVAALGALCGCVARAYERLIVERKELFT